MADVASILAQFEAGIAGKDTGLGATVKFDFEGAGCVFLDGKASPNTVSGDDQEADCTLTMSVETFENLKDYKSMTISEKITMEICKNSFLSFWSFANPVREDSKKELTDILVYNHPNIIIIFNYH